MSYDFEVVKGLYDKYGINFNEQTKQYEIKDRQTNQVYSFDGLGAEKVKFAHFWVYSTKYGHSTTTPDGSTLTQEEYDSLEQKEKSLEEMNQERNSEKIKELCDIVEANHAGAKFKRMFEDMRKKLHVDEKIQVDLNLKLDNTKLDEKILNEPISPKFNELEKDMDRKEKFKVVFRYAD